MGRESCSRKKKKPIKIGVCGSPQDIAEEAERLSSIIMSLLTEGKLTFSETRLHPKEL